MKDQQKISDEIDPYIPICRSLRPLLLGLTFAGLYHDNATIPDNIVGNGESKNRKCLKHRLIRYYHLIITVLMVGNFVRYIPSFWVGFNFKAEMTVPRIIISGWLVQCAITGVIMFVACEKNDHFRSFFSHYNVVITDEISKCIHFQTGCRKLNSYAIVAISVGIFVVLTNVVGNIVLSYLDDTETFRISMVNPMDHDNLPSTILIFIFFIFESNAWIMPVSFFLVISFTISFQFKNLFITFSQTVIQSKSSQMTCIRHIRQKHHQLCQAVEIIDRSFKYLIINYFGINIFLTMFISYQLINGPVTNTLTIVIYVFWILSCIAEIIIISLCSTNLTYWAHAPLDLLYDMQLCDEMTPRQLAELNLFLSRLTAAPIGLTVMGFFTVTKEVLLTLGGIFLTYFFLLLQFRIG